MGVMICLGKGILCSLSAWPRYTLFHAVQWHALSISQFGFAAFCTKISVCYTGLASHTYSDSEEKYMMSEQIYM